MHQFVVSGWNMLNFIVITFATNIKEEPFKEEILPDLNFS
jgi:hypothetical protein